MYISKRVLFKGLSAQKGDSRKNVWNSNETSKAATFGVAVLSAVSVMTLFAAGSL